MVNRKFLTTVVPEINAGAQAAVAFAVNDVLFTWTAFEIPVGAAELRTITGSVVGTDGVAGNTHDIHLYFARSINGTAPGIFSNNIHAAPSNLYTGACRHNIIGYKLLNLTNIDDADHLVGYNVLGSQAGDRALEMSQMILDGDPRYPSASGPGYQTLWVAGVTDGAFDFGTDVQLNQAGHQAAVTANTQITVEQGGGGTGDPRITYMPGDKLIGATGGPTMEVVSVDSGVLMTVKNVSEQIDNNEELVNMNPIRLHFGFDF